MVANRYAQDATAVYSKDESPLLIIEFVHILDPRHELHPARQSVLVDARSLVQPCDGKGRRSIARSAQPSPLSLVSAVSGPVVCSASREEKSVPLRAASNLTPATQMRGLKCGLLDHKYGKSCWDVLWGTL